MLATADRRIEKYARLNSRRKMKRRKMNAEQKITDYMIYQK